MKKIPIIYSPHSIGLKKNTLDFLFVPLSFSSAVKSNPEADIYFLNVNKNYKPNISGINYVDMASEYESLTKEIKNAYVHYSTNHAEFELFCIERFFVILKFMQDKNFKNAFLIETDVILLQNLNQFFSQVDEFDFNKTYLSEKKCISLGYVTFDYIKSYCEYVLDFYKNTVKRNKLEVFYNNYIEKGNKGGVCDMFFCDYINKGLYGAKDLPSAENFSDLFTTTSGNSVIFDSFIGRDHILDKSFKFEMEESYVDGKRIKKIRFDNGSFYVKTDEKSIELGSIHCQGSAKSLMADFFVRYF